MADFMDDYPTQRLHPSDGMAINADIWRAAHDYHRVRDQWHLRLAGDGILHGLQVVQTNPISAEVWILPGFAIDARGRTIVLRTPYLRSVGSTRGTVYVTLSANEYPLRDKAGAKAADDDVVSPAYLKEDVSVTINALPPDGDARVELARIHRSDDVAVKDADNPRRPRDNQIDMRFRREMLPRVLPIIRAGVLHLGGHDDHAWEGLDALAKAAEFARQCRLCISDDVRAGDIDDAFDLLYVRAVAPFTPEPALIAALKPFVGRRKVLFAEADSQSADAGAARAALDALLGALGVPLVPLSPGHALLTTPHRFSQVPEGATQGEMRVAAQGECHAILSDGDLGSVWRGMAHGQPALREAIRTAHEWGMNLLDAVLRAKAARQEAGDA